MAEEAFGALGAEHALSVALAAAEAAGQAALPYFRRAPAVENKAGPGGFDPVTRGDREAELALRARLFEAFPNHGLRGEEGEDERPESPYQWIMDPIDGTRAFITGLVHWGVLLGLAYEGQTVLGVMHQPFTGEFWWGYGARAGYRRGAHSQPLRTRTGLALAEAHLATTDPYLFPQEEAPVFQALRSATRHCRFGTDCYGYGMLAHGQLDLVLESGLSPWDIEPLLPIIRGAGGVVTGWDGAACLGPRGAVLASGCPALHEEALVLLSTL
jgi:myo-inositol-1(or 4)-monophosphatase